ncbi:MULTISPECIES: hypothetical protein [Hyphomonas]|nr:MULTISPECIES: hypothetical protein [Hyphomonas]
MAQIKKAPAPSCIAVWNKWVSVALASQTFGINETYYRYEVKLSDEIREQDCFGKSFHTTLLCSVRIQVRSMTCLKSPQDRVHNIFGIARLGGDVSTK